MNMRSHLHTQVNRKVSRFIMGEEGKVGSQSAFTAAAFIGATSLAGVFLSTPNASADGWCGSQGAWCSEVSGSPWCCACVDENLGCGGLGDEGQYVCLQFPPQNAPGVDCFIP